MSKCKNCNAVIKQTPGKRKKEFCDSTCRSNYWQKQARKNKPKEKAADIHIITSKEGLKTFDDAIRQVGYVRPKTLKQLKEMAPANLKGLERSAWIAANRKKYDI